MTPSNPVPPNHDGTHVQANSPPVEGTFVQASPSAPEATGVQVGGPHSSTQVRVRKDQPDLPGYRIVKRLGKGGMGVVWLAHDEKANRLVALKMTISDELTDQERQRFRTEAQAMAKLRHPNVVQVYEVNEFDGRPYFTMEYCPGGALNDYLDRKPQPAQVCAQILERLALGVQHAHENDIIHRDLKPANVLLSAECGVRNAESESDASKDTEKRQAAFNSALRTPHSELLKLTDFGLAKNLESVAQVTGSLDVMGTPSYMAPEQGSSTKKADARADVWSLGVILYEAITGSLPFVGADRFETYLNVCNQDPVPPGERVKCPKDLETICLKCLRKDPRDRYPTAQALADDLRAFQEGRSISARPMGRLEKTAKWVRKNSGVSLLLSLFILTLLSATLISLSFAEQSAIDADTAKRALKKVEDALTEATEQKKRRLHWQVEKLLATPISEVPPLLKLLEEDRDDLTPRLKEVWRQSPQGDLRLIAALALLPVEPDTFRPLLLDAILKIDHAPNFLLIRDVLKPFMNSHVESLWQQVGMDPKRHLRVLAALAAFDPTSPKWQGIGDSILEPLLSFEPFSREAYYDRHAFLPVRLHLIAPLRKVYHGDVLPELKYKAADLLRDYVSDLPEVKADLIRSGDKKQRDILNAPLANMFGD